MSKVKIAAWVTEAEAERIRAAAAAEDRSVSWFTKRAVLAAATSGSPQAAATQDSA